MKPLPKNPLSLPELRARISRFVTLEDAIVCAQVCKDWSNDFISVVWHTIDFEIHGNLKSLGPQVLRKYSHHIRVVKNLESNPHLEAILWSRATRITSLQMVMKPTSRYQAQCYDVIRQNRANLTYLHLSTLSNSSDKELFFSIDVLSPSATMKETSKLTLLKIQNLRLTRDAFSSLLQACPLLVTLDIRGTTFSTAWIDGEYQHTGVTCLIAPIKQVFMVDSKTTRDLSLLVHFPNLAIWKLWTESSTPDLEVPPEEIKDEVTKYCPALKTICTETSSAITTQLLIHGFEGLTKLCVTMQQLTPDVILAILTYRETLEHVLTYDLFQGFYEQEDVHEVEDHLQGHSWMMQILPQICYRLKTMMFPWHEINISEVEKTSWNCKDLTVLHIRIADLNTKEKISRTIQLWKEGRQSREGNLVQVRGSDSGNFPDDSSLEARVARLLLTFERLSIVWLGTRVYSV
ncbi:hypothetical protein EDD21DRAFT_406498 [Dissophora ornata]|nr:hypothetical protein BGZ58_000416 [Dissophora ornata]KAI8598859.1 hypothetical protein EDD21DRAFT_406498 [Dissophora ornata]